MRTLLLLATLLCLPAHAEEKFDRDTVIFIGSSTMGHWKARMDRDFLPVKTWNFGENGTDYRYLHETVTDWAKKFPARRWVVYSGDNDLNSDPPRTPAQVAADMRKTVELIRAQAPGAEVFVLSIKCRVYAEAESTCPQVIKANQLVRDAAGQMDGVTFVDTFSAMQAADRDQKKFFQEDGTHLNEAGYDIWRNTLKPLLLKRKAPAIETATDPSVNTSAH